ncbi:MAG: hypothetical protein J2P18_03570 [Nocardia sp.]|nr:hypothetical protein [Nocardia sp.]
MTNEAVAAIVAVTEKLRADLPRIGSAVGDSAIRVGAGLKTVGGRLRAAEFDAGSVIRKVGPGHPGPGQLERSHPYLSESLLRDDLDVGAADPTHLTTATAKIDRYLGSHGDVQVLIRRAKPGSDIVAAARDRVYRNAYWWRELTADEREAMIREHPFHIGNADGIPYFVRDRALRLHIRRELEWHLHGTPHPESVAGALRRDQRIPLENLQHVRDQLATIEREVAPNSPVQLTRCEPNAFGGKGSIEFSIGDADRAPLVTRQIGGFGTTLESSEFRARVTVKQHDMCERVRPDLPHATINDIGYSAPMTIPQVISPRMAEAGGDLVAHNASAYRATREVWAKYGGADEPELMNLAGFSFGTTTSCFAGAGERLKDVIDQVVLAAPPGAGPMLHASEFGIGADNVYVLAASDDPITHLGSAIPGRNGRFLGTGLGLDPANEAWGGVRVAAERPPILETIKRLNPVDAHYGYYAPEGDGLGNIAKILTGQGAEVSRVPARPLGQPATWRNWIRTPVEDPEAARRAGLVRSELAEGEFAD